jgi:pyruvate ferredoxin oxidoreductase alpha subunit
MELAMEGAIDVIKNVNQEFEEIFGRKYDLVENYKCEDAEIILIAMGSICGTIKAVIDDLREKGEKIGLLKVIAFRPFPKEDIYNAVKGARRIAVLDKNISMGLGGVLFNEIKAKMDVDASGFILGLGGRDVPPEDIIKIIGETRNPTDTDKINWIGIKEEE